MRAVGDGIYLLSLTERFSCNSYLACSGKKKILIDPGNSSLDELQSQLRQASTSVDDISAILLTHSHFDHVANVELFEGKKVFLHAKALEKLESKSIHTMLSDFSLPYTIGKNKHVVFKEREKIEFGELCFQPLFTPGHTDDSVCFFESSTKSVFAGDSWFFESLPRIFMPEGEKALAGSYQKLLDELGRKKSRKIFSGHSMESTDPINDVKNSVELLSHYA